MFEPTGDFEFRRVIVMDQALVAEYRASLQAEGEHVEVLEVTLKEFQEALLAGYLYTTGQLN